VPRYATISQTQNIKERQRKLPPTQPMISLPLANRNEAAFPPQERDRHPDGRRGSLGRRVAGKETMAMNLVAAALRMAVPMAGCAAEPFPTSARVSSSSPRPAEGWEDGWGEELGVPDSRTRQ
jgi:hypothetical protein